MIKSILKNPSKFILIVVFLLAFILRFYNTPFRFSLNQDSSRDALIAFEGAREIQLPLTGSFSSIGPITFGPWYYYQLIISKIIIPFDYTPWIYMGLASVFFVFIMYKIGEKLENKYLGLIVAFLVAISPSQVFSAQSLSNPNLIPVYAGLSILFFLNLLERRSYWWSLFFGFILGVGMNHHYQMAGFLVLPFIILVRRPKNYLSFLVTIIGVFLAFLPLLFFDLNNHWYNSRNLFYLYTEGRNLFYVPNRWLLYLRDFWPSFWSYTTGIPVAYSLIIMVSTSVIIAYLILKKKLKHTQLLLLIAFGVNFILLRYYWGERAYSYLQFLYPFVFLLTGYFIWTVFSIKRIKYLGFAILLGILVLLLPQITTGIGKDPFTIEMFREAELLMDGYPNKKISLYNCKDNYLGRTQAVAYLLAVNNRLDDSGEKIGFLDSRCKLPENISGFYPTFKDYVVNFSTATESAIAKADWRPISPKIIYDSNLRWWLNEQP